MILRSFPVATNMSRDEFCYAGLEIVVLSLIKINTKKYYHCHPNKYI